MKKPLILVTGATGFVGREAVAQLVDAHHPVRALVRDPAKAKSLGEAVEVIVGDLAKPDTFTPALRAFRRLMSSLTGLTFRRSKPMPTRPPGRPKQSTSSNFHAGASAGLISARRFLVGSTRPVK